MLKMDGSSLQAVRPSDILFALGVLALNVFVQPCTTLPKLVRIDAATYKLLRVMPVVAAVDAAACLVSIGLYRWEPRLFSPERALPTSKDDIIGKNTTAVQTRRQISGRYLIRCILAGTAGQQLARLTMFHGMPFSLFCAWALFMAFALNELLCYLAPNGLAEGDASVSPDTSVKERRRQIISTDELRSWIQTFIWLAILIEFLHIAWLGHFHVPQTLWMDWGPPQRSKTYVNTTLHFHVPPGVSRPSNPSASQAGELVYGFRPSHSFSGILILPLSYLIWIVPIFVWVMVTGWGALAIGFICFYGSFLGAKIILATLRGNTSMQRLIAFVASIINGVTKTPLPLRSCITVIFGFVLYFGGLLMLFVALALPIGPMYLILMKMDLDTYVDFSKELLGLDYIYFTMIDRPDGSYACLTGILVGGSSLILRGWIIPLILQRPKRSIAKDVRRYWTAAWIVALLSITSIAYYRFHFYDGAPW